MYVCKECGYEFTAPVKTFERHGLDTPPFETVYVCPCCKSTDYKKQNSTYCRCCGAKIINRESDYCCDECEIRGKKSWAKEKKRKRFLYDSELYQKVREIEKYNKTHATKLSYGQYESLQKETK